MTIEDLLIAEEIRALKAKYCYYTDLQDWDGFAGLFTQDASFLADTAVYRIAAPDTHNDRSL